MSSETFAAALGAFSLKNVHFSVILELPALLKKNQCLYRGPKYQLLFHCFLTEVFCIIAAILFGTP